MNSERNLEKLGKVELINLVEKLQNKARKPTEKPSNLVEKLKNNARKSKIAIVDNRKSPQDAIHLEIQKQVDSFKIHPDRPKPPKQPTLPRLRDAKGRFISRRQS